MIISASRRTDIPAFYAPWFFNRLRDGYLLVPNPFNPKAVSRVSLDPAVVDSIVFWTKNPAPMLPRLRELERYKYYFQFTLNPYGADVENRLPDLSRRIETFKRLSDAIGRDRVIWRYDPILTNGKYDVGFHCEAFARIARALRDHTAKCMLGFIDHYRHIRGALGELGVGPLRRDEIEVMAKSFVRALEPYPVALETCTVKVDLRHLGIPSGMCIDRGLVERIAGYPIAAKKDKNQRQVCNCIESIDVGTYETCLNGCAYCYALKGNYNTAEYNRRRHDPDSPLMIGRVGGDDVIREREMKSLRCERRACRFSAPEPLPLRVVSIFCPEAVRTCSSGFHSGRLPWFRGWSEPDSSGVPKLRSCNCTSPIRGPSSVRPSGSRKCASVHWRNLRKTSAVRAGL